MFARRTNPAIDKPILRKNIGYGEEQVRSGLADWVSSGDHSKGIIAREMLRSGKCFLPVETVSVSTALPRVELPGLNIPPLTLPLFRNGMVTPTRTLKRILLVCCLLRCADLR